MNTLESVVVVLLINIGIMVFYFLRQDHINKSGHLSDKDIEMDIEDLNNRIRRIFETIIKKQGCPPHPLLERNMVPTRLKAICRNYGLPGTILISSSFEETGGPPATIQRRSGDNYIVKIHPSYKEKYGTHSAILAHECAHIWVDRFLNTPPTNRDLERDTDVAAILLGAGALILGGMNQHADFYSHDGYSGVSIRTETLGYLTLAEYAYVMAAYVHFVAIDPSEMLEFLPPVSYRAFQKFGSLYPASPKCLQITRSEIVFQCNYCLKKLRVRRKDREKMIAVCPICRAEFSIKTSPISSRFFQQRSLKLHRGASPLGGLH